MAGHTIALYFHEQGHEVTAFSVKPFPYCANIRGDVFNYEFFTSTLLQGEYDLVINCIGILNQVAEDNPSKAVFLNSYLPHLIADVLKGTMTKFIHMSTDCVFAGNTGPYGEFSFPDGKTFYDRSKALGEVDDSKNLTFRNSIVGPDINTGGIGLFNWFMQQRGSIKGYSSAMWTGVTTLTLAKAMEQAATDNLCGIFNLVNDSNISKYELLKLFNNYFRMNAINIQPMDTLKLDKTLICTRRESFLFEVPSYEDMIKEMRDWVNAHKSLYQHYFLQ